MILENTLASYYPEIRTSLRALLGGASQASSEEFSPGVELPSLTHEMKQYLAASSLAHTELSQYRGKSLSLLDLTRNPATMTTKTFASLIIVARAIRFIQDTGERITILTPSSANKAVALRDAVLRAVELGLVRANQLNIIAVVPSGSVHKLRASRLSTDPELRARNPIGVYDGPVAGNVKAIARSLLDEHRSSLEKRARTNLWYTLQLENYLAADVVRALAEADYFPTKGEASRLHAHAVSSAYGLLGHAYGREMLAPHKSGQPSRYFLVQHLAAPDMVLSLYHDGSHDTRLMPQYSYEEESGRYVQTEDPRFPQQTFDPQEVLDPTFYTRSPATSPSMNALIHAQGGGGIVVSLAECLERYGQVRSLLKEAQVDVPANPTAVQEWSLVMAMTGVLNAIDRGLVADADVLVHGSGMYSRGDFQTLSLPDLDSVDDQRSLYEVVLKASAL